MARKRDELIVMGAREHNLRGVDVRIPKGSLTVFCGVSGSGKTSLAFDTIFAEGQRRYVESLSAYARQFLGQMPRPKFDAIRGLAPTVAIEQKSASRNPRSTVGTVTEVHDYLREVHARAAERVGPLRARMKGLTFGVYPNLSFLWSNTAFKVSHPRGPGKVEYWSWSVVPADAPDSVKKVLRGNHTSFFGPGGILEQEDSEAWSQQYAGSSIQAADGRTRSATSVVGVG